MGLLFCNLIHAVSVMLPWLDFNRLSPAAGINTFTMETWSIQVTWQEPTNEQTELKTTRQDNNQWETRHMTRTTNQNMTQWTKEPIAGIQGDKGSMTLTAWIKLQNKRHEKPNSKKTLQWLIAINYLTALNFLLISSDGRFQSTASWRFETFCESFVSMFPSPYCNLVRNEWCKRQI